MFSIAIEAAWIFQGVAVLDKSGASAVFEIVTSLAAHVSVLQTAKINPHMRKT